VKLLRVETFIFGQKVKVIECEKCQNEIYLQNGFANSCDGCKSEYNGFGQLLAPREEWGWETGETAADFLNMEDGDGWGYWEP
jgi:hypothetical protein